MNLAITLSHQTDPQEIHQDMACADCEQGTSRDIIVHHCIDAMAIMWDTRGVTLASVALTPHTSVLISPIQLQTVPDGSDCHVRHDLVSGRPDVWRSTSSHRSADLAHGLASQCKAFSLSTALVSRWWRLVPRMGP